MVSLHFINAFQIFMKHSQLGLLQTFLLSGSSSAEQPLPSCPSVDTHCTVLSITPSPQLTEHWMKWTATVGVILTLIWLLSYSPLASAGATAYNIFPKEKPLYFCCKLLTVSLVYKSQMYYSWLRKGRFPNVLTGWWAFSNYRLVFTHFLCYKLPLDQEFSIY